MCPVVQYDSTLSRRERDLRWVRVAIKGKRLQVAPELIQEAAGLTGV